MEEPMITEEQRDELKLFARKPTCPTNRASCLRKKALKNSLRI